MSFRSDVHRPHVENVFLTCVVDALIGEHEPAQNDQNNSNPRESFSCLCRLQSGNPAADDSLLLLCSLSGRGVSHIISVLSRTALYRIEQSCGSRGWPS